MIYSHYFFIICIGRSTVKKAAGEGACSKKARFTSDRNIVALTYRLEFKTKTGIY